MNLSMTLAATLAAMTNAVAITSSVYGLCGASGLDNLAGWTSFECNTDIYVFNDLYLEKEEGSFLLLTADF